ncbi:hypothetical protein CFK38_11990 [Brachybacterium vulturis]|uniref:Uncharacterized protein n=1 Tax=Brachybacterium vulturis TaxID=2017484 RepID=A0A291GQ54_9MICO|nr:hypothetical protein CFK38_11990 [Brachybacterium vulturis]
MSRPENELVTATELTDPDGDALTITSDRAGTWITGSSGGDEVTVGPFPMGVLRAALTQQRLSSGSSRRGGPGR